MSYAEVSTY